MAAKTQVIFRFVKGCVEYLWILLGQDTEVVTAVRHVTPAAVIILDGPMEKLFVLKLVGKRGL